MTSRQKSNYIKDAVYKINVLSNTTIKNSSHQQILNDYATISDIRYLSFISDTKDNDFIVAIKTVAKTLNEKYIILVFDDNILHSVDELFRGEKNIDVFKYSEYKDFFDYLHILLVQDEKIETYTFNNLIPIYSRSLDEKFFTNKATIRDERIKYFKNELNTQDKINTFINVLCGLYDTNRFGDEFNKLWDICNNFNTNTLDDVIEDFVEIYDYKLSLHLYADNGYSNEVIFGIVNAFKEKEYFQGMLEIERLKLSNKAAYIKLSLSHYLRKKHKSVKATFVDTLCSL